MSLIIKILILCSLYGIFRIIKEMINNARCPSDKDLKDVVLGLVKKNTAQADRTIMHLGVCVDCRERAKEIGSE